MSYLANFHHQILGPENGRRWIFVHGLMGFSSNWGRIVRSLEKTERVLIYDQRGHGRSFKPLSHYSPEDYAEDLHKIVKELGWQNFILVGHSMGARNCMVFTAQHPEMVEKLVLEDMGPDRDTESINYYEKLLNSIPTPFPTREAARSFFQNSFPSMMKFNEDPGVLSQFLYANLESKPDNTMDWRFSKPGMLETVRAGHVRDRWVEVASFKCPTLVIRGENSSIFEKETYEKMLQINPLIEGAEVKGSAHWVHFDNPDEFIKLITDFANK